MAWFSPEQQHLALEFPDFRQTVTELPHFDAVLPSNTSHCNVKLTKPLYLGVLNEGDRPDMTSRI
jgi:hypothetical protein